MRYILFFLSIFCLLQCVPLNGKEFSESEKVKYVKSTYADINVHRSQYSSRSKQLRQFDTVFNSVNETIPAPFSSVKALNRKYCSVVIAGAKKSLPLLLTSKDRTTVALLRSLTPGAPIKIYASLEYKKKFKQKHYFLEVRNVDSLRANVKASRESSVEFDEKDFMRIKPRRIDIQSKLFEGQKVLFKTKFKNISKSIPGVLLKGGMNPERIFLLPVEGLLTPVVVDKSNSQCVEAIIDADVNDNITVYAVLRNFLYTAGKRSIKAYYLVPIWISNETKVSDLPDE